MPRVRSTRHLGAPAVESPITMSEDTTAKPPVAPGIDGLPPELRRWAVAAIFTALALASLDTAIANIALPAIAADLHVSPADVVWVVNVYQIALVATLLPLGALGEIVGHQRIYIGGLLLFTIASIGCALAWSLPSLVAARALQGLGASGIMAVNAALVRYVYPTHMLGRGFGHNALVVGTAFTLVRADDRVRHSCAGPLAVAVRNQRSLRPDRGMDRVEHTATHATRNAPIRFRECCADHRLPRPLHHRDRQRCAQGSARIGGR